jgi:NAD(P)-dependent dehydrogenase (short-subunit alcohol dehydrogenase family)
MDVTGTVAAITGGASGIGRAAALELVRRGALGVVLADLNDERLAEAKQEVEALGAQVLTVHCDVTSDADMDRYRDETLAAFDHVDIVMNNAGVAMLGPAEGLSMEEWDWILQINLYGVIRGVRAFVPHLLERGSGYVVNTASVAGLFAYAWDHPAYITAKHGVVGLTESLALYLKPNGIGVSVLCPSLVTTNIGDTARLGGTDAMDQWLGEMPLGAPSTPEEVGVMVADAIRDDRYLILTDPDDIRPKVAARGADMDAFVADQIASLREPPNLYAGG